MAYLFGLLTEAEKEELEARGWSFENPESVIKELRAVEQEGSANPNNGVELVAVYVENDLHKIMDGPDWAKKEE